MTEYTHHVDGSPRTLTDDVVAVLREYGHDVREIPAAFTADIRNTPGGCGIKLTDPTGAGRTSTAGLDVTVGWPQENNDLGSCFLTREKVAELYRAVGDYLLGSQPTTVRQLRAFTDGDGDRWFEVSHDRLICAPDRKQAETNGHFGDDGRSEKYVVGHYGPLTPLDESA